MTLTAKQKTWDAYKAAQREERRRPMLPNAMVGLVADLVRTGSFYHDPVRGRGVRTPVMPSSRTRKHRNKVGRCRRGCECTNGAQR